MSPGKLVDTVARRLAERPHADVGIFPTPLQYMRRLSEICGRPIYFKRDDLAGLALGGNKIRMLRFTAGDAIARGADVFVAGGFTQTNHPVQVAAVGSALGVPTEVVLGASKGRRIVGNLLLHHLLNTKVHYVRAAHLASVLAACQRVMQRLLKVGRRPHLLTFTPEVRVLCALAYIEGFFELSDQLAALHVRSADIFVASGGPTYAGLLLGSLVHGRTLQVHGVPAPGLRREAQQLVMRISTEASNTLGIEPLIEERNVSLLGDGKNIYERLYSDAVHVVRAVARLEGVLLDPFYTANAVAEMMRWLVENRGTSPVIFIHTGGVAALFAHQSALAGKRTVPENLTLLRS